MNTWENVALQLYEAILAMQKARECPMVDDDFPRLLHRADTAMDQAAKAYEKHYRNTLE